MRLPTDAELVARPTKNSIPAHPIPDCALRQFSRGDALILPHAAINSTHKLRENWVSSAAILRCGKVPYSPTGLRATSEPSTRLGRLHTAPALGAWIGKRNAPGAEAYRDTLKKNKQNTIELS